MMNKSIRIVLDKTSHPGNIGAIARAMKNMNLSHLVLVQPKEFPNAEATARAAGAEEILANAVVVDTLAEALSGCELTIACSARDRALSWSMLNPREAAIKAVSHAVKGEVAFVFGNERSGLSNEELAHCQYQLSIPTQKKFSSLNLSHAVQVVVYELYVAMISEDESDIIPPELATADEIDQFYQHLRRTLDTIGFYHPTKSTTLMQKLKRLFSRAHLQPKEVQILRGILTAAEKSSE